MVYGLVRVTAPALEPVLLAEAKAHLRIDGNDEDTYIASLIVAARELTESLTSRALITQTFEMSLDTLPHGGCAVELPRSPVQAVSAIDILDDAGVPAAVDENTYEVDITRVPARVVRKYDVVWPAPGPLLGGVKITFVAGYGDAAGDVPAGLRRMILLLIAHWFERREAASDDSLSGLPFGVLALARPFMPVRL